MNSKQLIILVAALSFTFIMILSALLVGVKYFPTYLGMPPNPTDTLPRDTIVPYVEPQMVLSRSRIDSIQKELIAKDLMKTHNDSLRKIRDRLWNSLKEVGKNISQYKDSMLVIMDTISGKDKEKQYLLDSLERLRNQYKKSLHEYKVVQQHTKDLEELMASRYDSLELKNFETFAKIYNNAKPADVAKILEQIDEQDAAIILKMMQKKKAGKVLEQMLPEHAAAILIIGIE